MDASRTGEQALNDSVIGTDEAPKRYSGQERETIDRIRDCLGSVGFADWCLGNAVKYMDRAGRKGSFDEDRAKAAFYCEMAWHVRDPRRNKDPRRNRPDFKPYVYMGRPSIYTELADFVRGE